MIGCLRRDIPPLSSNTGTHICCQGSNLEGATAGCAMWLREADMEAKNGDSLPRVSALHAPH